MLYRAPGTHRLQSLRYLTARLLGALRGHRGKLAELDLMAVSPHLRRDLGLMDSDLCSLLRDK